ncbi:MAG: glycosyltransferase [Chlamydiales bacterium]|nr:glycosyltransferase [Chlamydiales bacterium]
MMLFFLRNARFFLMKFSVITVTYNAAAYLEQTLRSVAAQEFTDYEHLIWDGGSVDRTLEIARSFPHATLYEGQDEGIADAMNRGAALANGDFLIHLHADDLLAAPQVLAMVDTTLRLHPEVDWLYGRVKVIDFKGEYKRTTPYEPFSIKRLRRYNFISHPAVFIRRTLFERVGGFHKSLKYCMDYDLWLRLAAQTPPFALPTVLASFREHQYSLSTSEPLQVADEAYRVRNRYVATLFERYRSYRIWKKRRRKYFSC